MNNEVIYGSTVYNLEKMYLKYGHPIRIFVPPKIDFSIYEFDLEEYFSMMDNYDEYDFQIYYREEPVRVWKLIRQVRNGKATTYRT